MPFPASRPKKKNRSERWRSPAHCDHVRRHDCCVPGCAGNPIEVAHLRKGTDAGMGRKASDFYSISLCAAHHRLGSQAQHDMGEDSFAELLEDDPHWLARKFCESSPKAREIATNKRERGLV